MKMRYILPLSLMLAATTVTAADHGHHGKKMDPTKYSEHRIERMDKHAELGLSDVQKAQLKVILDETRQRHAEVRKQSDEKVNAVLTAEQRDKYAKHREQMKAKMKAAHGERKQGAYKHGEHKR